MSTPPVSLIPMVCLRCQTPLTAKPDEVAWVCPTCGQGLLLDDQNGLAELEIHFSAGIPPGEAGVPYWVAEGSASLQRSTYQGNQTDEMLIFWLNPRRFFIPAYDLPLNHVIETGAYLLRQPPELQPGSGAKFLPVTVPPDDVLPLAEFILLGIEANRKDALKELRFTLDLSEPELWVLPARSLQNQTILPSTG